MLLKRSRGFTLLELVVVITVISILGMVALERLLTYREQAEKVAMEQTVGILRSAMNLQIANLVASQKTQQIGKLAGQNPMDWLAEKPGNYLGELHDPAPEQTAPGNWYFDPQERVLVYLVEYGNFFVPDGQGKKRARFQVVRIEPPAKEIRNGVDITSIDSVKLAAVEPYRWFK
jgi:prepilin-type N-terminal cleavage/methylation domain-containing protein